MKQKGHVRSRLVLCALAAMLLLGCSSVVTSEESLSVSVPPSQRFSAMQITEAEDFSVNGKPFVLQQCDDDDMCRIVLQYGGEELEVFPFCSGFSDAWLIEGTVLAAPMLLVCADEMSDDYITAVCMLMAETAVVSERYAGRTVSVDTADRRLILEEQITVLGSQIAQRTYDILPDGTLQPAELGLYRIMNAEEQCVTLTTDLAAEIFRSGTWEATTLLAGTQMFPTETDGVSVVYVTLPASGALGRLRFALEDGTVFFDDLAEDEAFADLMYAG